MNRRGVFKKPAVFASPAARQLLGSLSKQALLDMAWNLAALGTDESEQEILTHAAREAIIVCEARGDAIPKGLREEAEKRIDSDPREEN